MRLRITWLASILALGGAAAFCVACSPSNASPVDDSGPDATTDEDAEVDAAPDSPANCSGIAGDCDLVTQDCPDGKECTPVPGKDGGAYPACRYTKPGQHLPKGSVCCPGTADNPCNPGLLCLGPKPCEDGKAPSGRCTPPCCVGDDSVCGQSPEGFTGHCDLSMTQGARTIFNVCTYASACKPFGVLGCPPGYGCRFWDSNGSASCIQFDGVPKKDGEVCSSGNDCEDNLVCVNDGDASRCHVLCLTPNSSPPFDAGALDGGVGSGGCPEGQVCSGTFSGEYPKWASFCR